ncbi:synaptotagmin-14b [Paramisgurnus dabryanus]|uniref:synaptotagmin-14b n=1 Tax=Paramisgurnus dabryanus TaxID=90735 RepID=UPI0031F396EF
MAFFKNFQQSLPSVSSLLDSVSTTVSSAVDDLSSAVSDVTYTVSDQLTEQVNTIINKVQTEDDDKFKKDESEGCSDDIQKERRSRWMKQQETEAYGSDLGTDGEGRKSKKSKKNSMWTLEVDEEEIMREKERQEEARRAEEEEWEWCYAPSKGWYRKRKDPNQSQSAAQSTDNQKGNNNRTLKEEPAAQDGELCNEKTNRVHLSNNQEDQNSQEMPGGPKTMKKSSNYEENEEHENVEEDNSSESPGRLNRKDGKASSDEDLEEDIKGKITNSNAKKSKKGKDGSCPERSLSGSDDESPKSHKDMQKSERGNRVSEKGEKKDCSGEASPEQVKRKKGSSSLNESQSSPYQDKEDMKKCSTMGRSSSVDTNGSEVSECSEDPDDTESCLNKDVEEEAPIDSTTVLGPEVKKAPRHFPRCVLL